MNALSRLKKFAIAYAKTAVPGYTLVQLRELGKKKKIKGYYNMSALELAGALGISKSASKTATKTAPATTPKSTTAPEPKASKPNDFDLDAVLAEKGGFKRVQSLLKAAGVKPGTSAATVRAAYKKWKGAESKSPTPPASKIAKKDDLEAMKMPQLREAAKQYGVKGRTKADLIDRVRAAMKASDKKEETKVEPAPVPPLAGESVTPAGSKKGKSKSKATDPTPVLVDSRKDDAIAVEPPPKKPQPVPLSDATAWGRERWQLDKIEKLKGLMERRSEYDIDDPKWDEVDEEVTKLEDEIRGHYRKINKDDIGGKSFDAVFKEYERLKPIAEQNGLSAEEALLIHNYMEGGVSLSRINKTLRDPKFHSELGAKDAAALATALRSLPDYRGDVRRTEPQDQEAKWATLQPGDEYSDPGFVSTSRTDRGAIPREFKGAIDISIRSKTGKSVRDFWRPDIAHKADEVILQPNTRMRVVSNEVVDGKRKVVLEEVGVSESAIAPKVSAPKPAALPEETKAPDKKPASTQPSSRELQDRAMKTSTDIEEAWSATRGRSFKDVEENIGPRLQGPQIHQVKDTSYFEQMSRASNTLFKTVSRNKQEGIDSEAIPNASAERYARFVLTERQIDALGNAKEGELDDDLISELLEGSFDTKAGQGDAGEGPLSTATFTSAQNKNKMGAMGQQVEEWGREVGKAVWAKATPKQRALLFKSLPPKVLQEIGVSLSESPSMPTSKTIGESTLEGMSKKDLEAMLKETKDSALKSRIQKKLKGKKGEVFSAIAYRFGGMTKTQIAKQLLSSMRGSSRAPQ